MTVILAIPLISYRIVLPPHQHQKPQLTSSLSLVWLTTLNSYDISISIIAMIIVIMNSTPLEVLLVENILYVFHSLDIYAFILTLVEEEEKD